MVQRTALLLHWEFNEALAFRLKIHITAIPFPGPLELFPLYRLTRFFASSPQGSALTLFFSPIAGKEVLDLNSKTPVPQNTSAFSTHMAYG